MVSFSETHEVISTMLWGFVIVIKRNGTDGSTFPMVNEVKLRSSEKSREEWSCSGVPPWARGRLRHQDPASSCLQGACKDKSPSRRSEGIPSQFIIWLNHQNSVNTFLNKGCPYWIFAKVYITALSKTNATKLNDNVLENEVFVLNPPSSPLMKILALFLSRCLIFSNTAICSQLGTATSVGSFPQVSKWEYLVTFQTLQTSKYS